MKTEKSRIWELDAFRGICLIGMIMVHFVFDLIHFGGFHLEMPSWFYAIKQYGHILFVVLSGICVTLASSSFQRGAVVFAAGMLISYVTLFLDLILGLTNMRIWFGILHMLGICMMLYPIFRKLPSWSISVLGIAAIAAGLWFARLTTTVPFLFPLGLCSEDVFVGSDYFPLFPGLGWFLVGAFIGKTAYREKESRLKQFPHENSFVRFLQTCGKHSLLIYLAHQPVLVAVSLIASWIL